jgi:hypothetical protein
LDSTFHYSLSFQKNHMNRNIRNLTYTPIWQWLSYGYPFEDHSENEKGNLGQWDQWGKNNVNDFSHEIYREMDLSIFILIKQIHHLLWTW